jgi:hypothetical protein
LAAPVAVAVRDDILYGVAALAHVVEEGDEMKVVDGFRIQTAWPAFVNTEG